MSDKSKSFKFVYCSLLINTKKFPADGDFYKEYLFSLDGQAEMDAAFDGSTHKDKNGHFNRSEFLRRYSLISRNLETEIINLLDLQSIKQKEESGNVNYRIRRLHDVFPYFVSMSVSKEASNKISLLFPQTIEVTL